MKNRIDLKFAELRDRNQKAFVPYITAGDPDLAETVKLALALEKAGADIIELGVPFSDPLADGVVIQLSSQRALEGGTTLKGIFEAVKSIRQKSEIPLVLFTYFNPINRYGLDRFFADAEKHGVDGVLILDLPPEEADKEINSASKSKGLKMIRLIAPTSPEERIKAIAQASSGFIYYVSREGVTGMQAEVSKAVAPMLEKIKRHGKTPVCVGFGISTPAQAKLVAQCADGVVIGSALVDCIAQGKGKGSLAEKLEAFARPLAEAIHG